VSEDELTRALHEANERVASLERSLEHAERRLKRLQSGLVWSGWIAILAVIAFFLGRTLFPKPEPIVDRPPEAVLIRPENPSKPVKIPVYDPPPSVSEPAEPPAMPGF